MGPSQEQASPSPTPIIPQTGAAPYWYVDPSTQNTKDFTSIPSGTPNPQELQQLEEALRRLGVLPQGTTPSF